MLLFKMINFKIAVEMFVVNMFKNQLNFGKYLIIHIVFHEETKFHISDIHISVQK